MGSAVGRMRRSWSLRRIRTGADNQSCQRKESTMKSLNGTKTHENLKAAFAGESQANRRYLYFANKANIAIGAFTVVHR